MAHSVASAGLLLVWLRRTHKITKSPCLGVLLVAAVVTPVTGLAVGIPSRQRT
jgi:hypothetical protein